MQKFQKGQAVLYTGPNFKGFASNVLTTIISYDKDLIFPYLINANGKKICATTSELSKSTIKGELYV